MISSTTKSLTFSFFALMAAMFAATAAEAQVIITDPIRDDGQIDRPTESGNRPSYVRLRNLSYAGSGCPAGSVATNVSASRDSFTLLFDSFVAESGRGIPLSQSRKNCMLSVDLDFPSGWSYTVDTLETQGYVALDPGVRADVTTSFYFQGQTATARFSSSFYGPTSRDYHIRDTLGLSAQVWSPCGMQRALNLNYSIRVSGGSGGRGLITMDSPVDGSPRPFTLRWQRCR